MYKKKILADAVNGDKIMNIRKKIISISSILIILILFSGFQCQQNKNLYTNKTYHISLKYNKAWKSNPKYFEKYEGKDGFFQISASTGENLTIDEVAQSEVTNVLKPYGSNPKITKLNIQGQNARLIKPSKDQSQLFNNQAELIVKYPKKIKVGEDFYTYFILWADKYHIEDISKTLKFINY